MANSADPDQLASYEANWSGSILFAKGFSRTRVYLLAYYQACPKFWTSSFYYKSKCLKTAGCVANSVDNDQSSVASDLGLFTLFNQACVSQYLAILQYTQIALQ